MVAVYCFNHGLYGFFAYFLGYLFDSFDEEAGGVGVFGHFGMASGYDLGETSHESFCFGGVEASCGASVAGGAAWPAFDEECVGIAVGKHLHNLKIVAARLVSAIGRIFPKMPVKQKPDRGYAESLHTVFNGEWDYRRDWKPDILPDPDAGWVRAIQRAQQELRHRRIDMPVLLMHSAESVRSGDGREKYSRADAILDVDGISRYGRMLGPDVTEVSFPGGLHDLVLSSRDVRERVYATMLDWLRDNVSL